jgi:serine/threonine-protein kinase
VTTVRESSRVLANAIAASFCERHSSLLCYDDFGLARQGNGSTEEVACEPGRLHYEVEFLEDLEDAPTRDLSEVVGDRYRLLRVIGEGGTSRVYAAEHVDTRGRFAVKVLSDAFCHMPVHVERFLRGARATAGIEHPNIVEIADWGPTRNGSVFFAMELLEGEDLGVTLQREGPQPWPRVRHLMLQLCAALHAAHEGGVVHRDIKPGNCFRTTRDGDADFVKILDFGIAKVIGEESRTGRRLTWAGQIFGTPEYMSPERVRGESSDPRMDVYAAGIILFELLTGRTPFEGHAPLDIMGKHIREPVPSIATESTPRVPPDVDAIVQRALAKNASERFQSARELRDALERVAFVEHVPAAR